MHNEWPLISQYISIRCAPLGSVRFDRISNLSVGFAIRPRTVATASTPGSSAAQVRCPSRPGDARARRVSRADAVTRRRRVAPRAPARASA